MTKNFLLNLLTFVLYFKTPTFREECAQHLENPTQVLQLVHPFESWVIAVLNIYERWRASRTVKLDGSNG
jgi:hypothetical protein